MLTRLVVVTLVLIAVAFSGCGEREETTSSPATVAPPLPPPGSPITFSTVCAACHGLRGEGNRDLRTPSIAGLPAWYVPMLGDVRRVRVQRTEAGWAES